MHAVHRLYLYRKSLSTTTYRARGQRVQRCEFCRLAEKYCICQYRPLTNAQSKIHRQSNAGFLLLMYDTEILKPSNTGKLIADLIPDTFAFLWSRTEKNAALQTVLDDPTWQPFVVFPEEYVDIQDSSHIISTVDTLPQRDIFNQHIKCVSGKRPLFIMLDGSWREAKKMFRKSPYLNSFPVVSFKPEPHEESSLIGENSSEDISNPLSENNSRYHIRKTDIEYQYSTAEVAARVLAMYGEETNAKLLDLWFDVFSYQYQKSVCQTNKGNANALDAFIQFSKEIDNC